MSILEKIFTSTFSQIGVPAAIIIFAVVMIIYTEIMERKDD